ncbi:MAG: hypothetical protein ABT940_04165 [Alphaproteobacteria bacterium]
MLNVKGDAGVASEGVIVGRVVLSPSEEEGVGVPKEVRISHFLEGGCHILKSPDMPNVLVGYSSLRKAYDVVQDMVSHLVSRKAERNLHYAFDVSFEDMKRRIDSDTRGSAVGEAAGKPESRWAKAWSVVVHGH